MINNLQKDLEENTEKYNKSHQHHRKVKAINCQYCYPISKDANISKNFIKFQDWLTSFHSTKTCTSLTLFYFKRVIKARAKNAIINNISELCQIIIFDPIPTEIDDVRNTIENILYFRNNFDEKDIKTSKSSPSTLKSKSLKLIKTFKTKYLKSPRTSKTPKISIPEVITLIAISSPKETKDSKEKIEISLIIFSDSDLKITKSEETEYSYLNLILDSYLDL